MSRLEPLSFVDNEDDNLVLGTNVPPPAPGRRPHNNAFQLEPISPQRHPPTRHHHPRPQAPSPQRHPSTIPHVSRRLPPRSLPREATIQETSTRLRNLNLDNMATQLNIVSRHNGFSPLNNYSQFERVMNNGQLRIPSNSMSFNVERRPTHRVSPRRDSPTTRSRSPSSSRR